MAAPLELPRHPVVFGHPLHAMLSDLPVTLIPSAFLVELASRARPSEPLRKLSDAVSWCAFAAGSAAGVMGWIDWLTMPTEHPAQRTSTVHGLINSAAVLGVLGAAAMPRRRLPLLGLAGALVAAGGWLGGEIVFHHGWRVRPAEEAEIASDRLRRAGLGSYFAEAQAEVSEFERNKTFTTG